MLGPSRVRRRLTAMAMLGTRAIGDLGSPIFASSHLPVSPTSRLELFATPTLEFHRSYVALTAHVRRRMRKCSSGSPNDLVWRLGSQLLRGRTRRSDVLFWDNDSPPARGIAPRFYVCMGAMCPEADRVTVLGRQTISEGEAVPICRGEDDTSALERVLPRCQLFRAGTYRASTSGHVHSLCHPHIATRLLRMRIRHSSRGMGRTAIQLRPVSHWHNGAREGVQY